MFLKYTIGVSIIFELFKFSIINVTNNRTEIAEGVYTQHINEKFGVEVQLIHREQNMERVLNSRV